MRPAPARAPLRVESGVLDRLQRRLANLERRWHRDGNEGYGSNSWAVMGSATTDGSSLLAGDGHLQLSSPSLFWQYGLDTVLMGEQDGTRLIGATIPGIPSMGVGTNGRIAWTQTAYFADVTDWYTEELVLGADGLPASSRFGGADRPLVRIDEAFVIADVPALDSEGRTEMIPRFTTFDGRWIASIEGRPTTPDAPLGPGEARLNVMGDLIVPGDVDGFLADHGLSRSQVDFWICHPGGPKILEAFQESLGLTRDDLAVTWECLRAHGNLSSASVLFVLHETLRRRSPKPGDRGLLMAMGPGFCSELVLLQW